MYNEYSALNHIALNSNNDVCEGNKSEAILNENNDRLKMVNDEKNKMIKRKTAVILNNLHEIAIEFSIPIILFVGCLLILFAHSVFRLPLNSAAIPILYVVAVISFMVDIGGFVVMAKETLKVIEKLNQNIKTLTLMEENCLRKKVELEEIVKKSRKDELDNWLMKIVNN